MIGLGCLRCGAEYPCNAVIDSRGCPRCYDEAPANLQVLYEATDPGSLSLTAFPLPSLWRYARHLPCDAREAVSLGEGLTPLLAAPRLGADLGVPKLLIKNESGNPTGSHKDRFSTVAVSAARELGAKVVATSSSGNAGASLAAYAGRAGLECVVATFAGAAGPMLQQMQKYGARVVPFARKADRWRFLTQGAERAGWCVVSPFHAPVVGSHPIGIEGYKTLAYEIVEQMQGAVPDWCVLPVCYGDVLSGLWRGFKELHQEGTIATLPRLVAAEAHGSLARAMAGQSEVVPEVEAAFRPLAVSVGATRSTFQALIALRESDGLAVQVGNAGLIELQERMARREGIFAELSSVMPLAAIRRLRRDGAIQECDLAVAVVTASGLKDLDLSAQPLEGFPPPFGQPRPPGRILHSLVAPAAGCRRFALVGRENRDRHQPRSVTPR
jgi:threonine synthase